MLFPVVMVWGQNNNGNLGETLTLSGQLRESVSNRDVSTFNRGGSGSIADGQFNFTIGTPTNLDDIADAFRSVLWQSADTIFSDPAVRAYALYLSIGSGASIVRATPDFTTSVFYFYVDRDVTIRRGRVQGVNAFNLPLKKGWNAILRIDFTTYSLEDRVDLSWSISQDM